MKKTLTNIFYSCCVQLLGIIVPLITSPYISRILRPTNLGIYTYIDSVSQVFMTIGLIGLSNYGIREIAYSKDNKKERSKTFFEIMILRIILLAISYFCYCFFMKGTKYEMYSIYQIIWFAGSFLDVVWVFNGLEDFKTVVLRTVLVKTVNVFCIFIFIKSPADLLKYILLMGICKALGTLICYKSLKRVIEIPNFKELNIFRHLIPTLKIALPQIVTLIFYQMDKIMLEWILDDSAVLAFYDLADKIVKIPVTAITAISTVMLPKSSKYFIDNDHAGLTKSLQATVDFSIMLIIPMFLGLMSISCGFVPWFYGSEYLEVSYIIITLCPVIIARGLSSISSSQYLVPTKNTRYLTYSSVFAAIINVVINFITIPILGVYGAVLGTIFAEFSVTIIQFYYMLKDIKIKDMSRSFIRYTLFGCIACGCSLVVWYLLDTHIYTTILQIGCAMIVYLGLLVVSKDKLLENIHFKK